ncbi:MAG: oligosaccharide flippase family protein, partial [Thermoproteota archaeon]
MAKEAPLTAAGVAVGSIYLTLQNVLSTLIGVLGYAYMARAITLAEMGVMAGVTLLSSLAQIALDLGLNSSVAKFTSEEVGRGADYSKYLLSALTLRIPLTLAVTSQISVFSTYISEALFNTPNYSGVLSLAAVDIALLSISPLLNNTLWGSGRLMEMAIYGFSSVALRWAFITAFL